MYDSEEIHDRPIDEPQVSREGIEIIAIDLKSKTIIPQSILKEEEKVPSK